MRLVVVGVNHKTAPVGLRERLAFGTDLPNALQELKVFCAGAMILSTCNRTEVYVYMDNAQDERDEDGNLTRCALGVWLAKFKQISEQELLPHLYAYENNLALTHWLRVAVGLDSMILGEPQILGQIRQAVAVSYEHHAIGKEFDWLIQRVFAAARTVRRDTDLGKQAVSLGFATAKLVTQIFDDPSKTTLMIVAAGEMNRLVAHNVSALGMSQVIICNRSYERAVALADELRQMAQQAGRPLKIELPPLDDLPKWLSCADVVSSCSGSMHALIDKAMVKQAMKARKNRPVLMVDLAVPRDIDPDVGDVDNVYLYSIDDLQTVIQGNALARQQAAVEAELLVGQLVSQIETDLQIKRAGQAVAVYHALLHQKKQALLEEALAQLPNSDDPKALLENFAHRLTQTLAHPSTKLIRQSATWLSDDELSAQIETLLGAYRKS